MSDTTDRDTQSDILGQAENAFESSARALSEFVIRAVLLPISLPLTKPSAIARSSVTGSFRPLPSPFLLALVTGVIVSGLAIVAWMVFQAALAGNDVKAVVQDSFANYSGLVKGGLESFLLAIPYIAIVWSIAGLISILMLRGVRSAEPLFAGLSLCLSAIVEVAAMASAVIRLWPASGLPWLNGGGVWWIILGVMLYALLMATKLIRLVWVLRKDHKTPLIGAVLGSIPSLVMVLAWGLFIASATAAISLESRSDNQRVQDATRFSEVGNQDRAIQAYNEALAANPQDTDALLGRGRAYLGLETPDYDHAIADFTAAIEAGRTDADTYYARASAYFRTHQYAHAIDDYDQVITLVPGSATVYNQRCWARAVWGQQLEQALADCTTSLRLSPDDPNTSDSRGLVNLRLGDSVRQSASQYYQQSVQDYDLAVRYDAENPNARAAKYRAESQYGRGLGLLRLGRTDEGNADLQAATTIYPQVGDMFAGYGVELQPTR